MTVAMNSTTLTWEQTLAALLPLVGTRLWATTNVNRAPVSAFSERLRSVDVRPTPYTGVESCGWTSATSPGSSSFAAMSTSGPSYPRTAGSPSRC